jgi:hypothetical protein
MDDCDQESMTNLKNNYFLKVKTYSSLEKDHTTQTTRPRTNALIHRSQTSSNVRAKPMKATVVIPNLLLSQNSGFGKKLDTFYYQYRDKYQEQEKSGSNSQTLFSGADMINISNLNHKMLLKKGGPKQQQQQYIPKSNNANCTKTSRTILDNLHYAAQKNVPTPGVIMVPYTYEKKFVRYMEKQAQTSGADEGCKMGSKTMCVDGVGPNEANLNGIKSDIKYFDQRYRGFRVLNEESFNDRFLKKKNF